MQFKFIDRATPASVEDWRQRAKSCLPDMAWYYIESGAEDCLTLGENLSGFSRWRLRQRSLRGIKQVNLKSEWGGESLALPIALAPTGSAGFSHWRGDIAASRAAERKGTRAVISTAASYTLEEIADATESNHWFQLYPFGDRAKVAGFMDRARAAAYTALFVTVDVPTIGNREGERRHGLQPLVLTPGRLLNMMRYPRWLCQMLVHRRLAAVHYLESNGDGSITQNIRRVVTGAALDAVASAENQARYMQADLSWEDLAWMRDQWHGKLYVKGILDPEDAFKAVHQIGADGVVVSNHGGRQLDRSLSSIEALPAVIEKLAGKGEVFLDGGVRRGTDVITALCLGAKGVLIGRPYLYGLAAGGEAGVVSILDIFETEMRRAMTLMGCTDIAELDRSWLVD